MSPALPPTPNDGSRDKRVLADTMDEYLYRAVYTDEHGRTRRLTFAAPGRKAAEDLAEHWKLPGETLTAVAMLRRLSKQFALEP